jgi:hypothetical protein
MKKAIVLLAIVIIVAFLITTSFVNYSQSTLNAHEEIVVHEPPKVSVEQYTSFKPPHWGGTNISFDNPLWKTYDQEDLQMFTDSILAAEGLWTTEFITSMVGKFSPIIGINGCLFGLLSSM